MKKKDIISLIVACVIFVFVLAMIYRFFFPATKDDSIKVIVPRPIETTFNESDVNNLNNPNLVDPTPDLTPNFEDKQKVF